mmetsp:Transcript_10501/g.34766  ORF Transcript_10501/g.34766 Transcript_10501/m.34766 type:complete len:282 (+) Transcript_10501:4431-5276(+)
MSFVLTAVIRSSPRENIPLACAFSNPCSSATTASMPTTLSSNADLALVLLMNPLSASRVNDPRKFWNETDRTAGASLDRKDARRRSKDERDRRGGPLFVSLLSWPYPSSKLTRPPVPPSLLSMSLNSSIKRLASSSDPCVRRSGSPSPSTSEFGDRLSCSSASSVIRSACARAFRKSANSAGESSDSSAAPSPPPPNTLPFPFSRSAASICRDLCSHSALSCASLASCRRRRACRRRATLCLDPSVAMLPSSSSPSSQVPIPPPAKSSWYPPRRICICWYW